MVRIPFFYLVLMCLPLLTLLGRDDDPIPSLKAEAGAVIKTYSSTLMTTLRTAVDNGGPVVAIGACNEQAGPIAADIAETSGWSIKRTGAKIRNPDAAPDAFEQRVLAMFQDRIRQGEAVSDLTWAEIVPNADGGPTFRFAKAIPMGEACVTCHGADLKPEIAAKLRALYPQDQAVGFTPGDMRGIFSLGRAL